MNKFSEINSIRIKKDEENKSIFINNKKVETYGSCGVILAASEIEAVAVNDLANLHPIMVEIDESYIKLAKVSQLENKVVSLRVLDDNYIEVFPTVVTPVDIEKKGLHDQYQKTLESIVKDDKSLRLYTPVRGKFPRTEKKKLEALKESAKDSLTKFDFSEVGYLQFTYYAKVETFNDVFQLTNTIIARLDKKVRAILKTKK
jgi:hypothetical protein